MFQLIIPLSATCSEMIDFSLYENCVESMKLFMDRLLAQEDEDAERVLVTFLYNNCPIDSPPFCPGFHDLRIACLDTYYNMKAISIYYNITNQLSD